MPMPAGGRDISLLRNPNTGQFSLFNWDSTGNPLFDDSDSYTVLSCLLEDEGGYWADPTGQRGSTLHKIKLDITGTASQIKTSAAKALAYAVANALIESATVTSERKKAGRFDIRVQYKNRRGQTQTARVSLGD